MNQEGIGSFFDTRAFRNALGCFPTGVAIVTAKSTGSPPVGMTINSFSSVSLAPPLILWSLRKNAFSRDSYIHAGRFVINVLCDDQKNLAMRFSKPQIKHFDGVEICSNAWGVPYILGSAASFDCKTVDTRDAGDHLIFIGLVENFFGSRKPPLVFCQGNFTSIGEHAGAPG